MNRSSPRARIALLIVAATALLASCHMDFSIPSDARLQLSVYHGARLVSSRGLAGDDQTRRTADRWLAANRDGWQYGFRTRPPEVVLSGKDFSINVLDGEVAVKYCHGVLQCHLWIKKDHELRRELLITADSDLSVGLPTRNSVHGSP